MTIFVDFVNIRKQLYVLRVQITVKVSEKLGNLCQMGLGHLALVTLRS